MLPPMPFDAALAERLRRFLAAPERPEGTFSYPAVAGFLFAICCSPELVQPSEWLPLVFNDQPGAYRDMEEAQQVLSDLMALYNSINRGVFEKEPALPPGCEASRDTLANFAEGTPFSEWARGFGAGHDYLSELWDAYTPDALSEDLGSCMMVLTFFASRELAEAYRKEMGAAGRTLEEMAEAMLGLVPEALLQYALIGRSIADVVGQKSQPARSTKVGRNEPCPCGSGKKYKHCCGATLH